MTSETLILHALKFREAVSRDAGYAELKSIIEEDPAILACFGRHAIPGATSPPYTADIRLPLLHAVMKDDLEMARAILDVMTNSKYTPIILKQLEVDGRLKEYCPTNNPLYIKSKPAKDMYYVHSSLYSAQMMRLLKSYDYDFNIHDPKQNNSYYGSLISTVCGKNSSSIESGQYSHIHKLRWGVDLGIDPNQRYYYVDDTDSPCDFASYFFLKLQAKGKAVGGIGETTLAEILTLAAKLGVDFRAIISDQNMRSREQRVLRQLAKTVPELYCAAETVQDRKDYARAACSLGLLPQLMNMCIAADRSTEDNKKITELASYLPNYWKNEYPYIIEATLARTSPVEKSALAKYLRDNSPPFSPGRA